MSDPTDGAGEPVPSDADTVEAPTDGGPFEAGELGPPPGTEPDEADGTDGGSTWGDALRSTEPDMPLSDVESPWNPEEGGASRVYRGFQKATGTDGVPAWVDLILGAAEVLSAVEAGDDGIDASEAREAATDAVEGVTDMGGEAPETDI